LKDADTTDYYLEISLRKNLGAFMDDYEQYDEALQYYEEAIPFAIPYSKKELASIYGNMGNAYRDLRDAEQMLRYYFLSQEISREIGDVYADCKVSNRIGLAFYHAGSMDTAEYYFHKAYTDGLSLTGNQRTILGKTLHNLAQLYFHTDRSELAASTYQQALQYKKGNDLFVTLNDLGEVLLDLHQYDSARRVLTQALALYPGKNTHDIDHHKVYDNLANLELATGNTAQALVYKDSLSAAFYQYGKIQQEMKAIATKDYSRDMYNQFMIRKQQKERNKFLLWVLVGLGVLVVVIGVPTIWYYYSNKQNKGRVNNIQSIVKE
jgi:tetratricopeptide (TPR) repeat protein